MSHENPHVEENIARLIEVGLGPQARPEPTIRGQTWRLLKAQLYERRDVPAFSNTALAVLTGILTVLAVWLIGQVQAASGPVHLSLSLILVALLVTANLLWVPIAGILIVIRRRHA